MMILVVLALLAAPSDARAGVARCDLATYNLATYNLAAEPAAAELRNAMALSPGQLFRKAISPWFGPTASAGSIVKVTVRDEDFQLIRVIDSERDLTAFRALWGGLVEADPGSVAPPPGSLPYYKLNIETAGRGRQTRSASWFYFPRSGTIQLLAVIRSVLVAPLYRTPTPDAFEALLRAERP
jgi:hypothetical protein